MIFLGAIIFGLIFNYLSGGTNFHTSLCFFVGLFLIMPILLKIKRKEIKKIFKNKKILLINIILNFLISPIIAFIIGFLIFEINNYNYIIIIILLSIIPGGGLLMNWLEKDKADINTGFLLFSFNLLIFSIIYIIFNFGVEYFIGIFNSKKEFFNIYNNNFGQNYGITNQVGCSIENIGQEIGIKIPGCFEGKSSILYGLYGFIVLIVIPFFFSRVILFISNKQKFIKVFQNISKFSAFILISYIFSLNYIRGLIDLKFTFILKILFGTITYYIIFFIIIITILKKLKLNNNIKKSIFWNAYTRFITLSLILSFLYAIAWKIPEVIIISIIAYFIQIISATLISSTKILNKI